MKTLLINLFFAFLIVQSTAQQSITINGKITDKDDNPIAYANIVLTQSSIGVVSNLDGNFRITIKEAHINDSIKISSMGYTPIIKSIHSFHANKNNVFVLKQKTYKLDEITVKPETGLEVVLKAISKIRENYNTNAYYLDAFYRESLMEDSIYTQLSEAACRFHMDSLQKFNFAEGLQRYISDGWYSSNETGYNLEVRDDNSFSVFKNDQLQIINARSTENNSNSLVKFTLIGGPMSRMGCDKTRYPLYFLDKKRIKNYNYSILDIIQDGNNRVYKIHFWPRKKRKVYFEGIIYIDKKNYAFVGFDYKLSNYFSTSRAHLKRWRVARGGISYNQRKPIADEYLKGDYQAKIRYQKIDNKWYLKSVHQESELTYIFTKEGSKTKTLAIYDLLINKVITKNISVFIDDSIYKHVSQSNLFNYPFSYNKEFWNKNNMLLPTRLEQKAINDLEKYQSLQEQFENKNKYDSALIPPKAKKALSFTVIHEDTLYDDYAWMKNREDTSVQNYLNDENKYLNNYRIPLLEIERSLFYEMKNRIPEEDEKSVPYKMGDYLYYTISNKDLNYPKFYRKKDSIGSQEELVLDIPKLAHHSDSYIIADIKISPNDSIMAYSEDKSGIGNLYYLFKNLKSNQYFRDTLFDASSLIWMKDNKAIIYTVRDSLRRVYQIKEHVLKTHQSSDKILFDEKNITYFVSINQSKSKEYLFLYTGNSNEQKVYICDLSNMPHSFHLLSGKSDQYEIFLQHFSNDSVFYIFTNKDAPNWKLCKTPIDKKLQFNNIIANKEQSYILKDYLFLQNYMVIIEQKKLSQRIKITDNIKNKTYYIKEKEDYCTMKIKKRVQNIATDSIVYTISTLGKPSITYSYNLKTKKKRIIKENKVIGFSESKYKTELIWATAEDGTKIPIFLFYNKKQSDKKTNYLIMNAYGAYGSSLSYSMPISYLSLIDKGFVYAQAYIRGGSELGEEWSKNGKLLNKLNSLNDFISCSKFLIDKGYTSSEKFVIEGGSAGGLVIGFAINTHPELYKAAILSRPFVDVLNTLLDTTISVTSLDWDEWGNPYEKKYYNYIKKYSPYDNIKAQSYPNLLFITGAKDEQVNYWEPAKMMAKLRDTKTNSNTILLKTYMNTGHSGASGKYGYYNEQAMRFAFILNSVGYYRQ